MEGSSQEDGRRLRLCTGPEHLPATKGLGHRELGTASLGRSLVS